ncbi:MAG: dCTP deaminase [bacterium]|nr:dCTP deaminase [bacterium]
MSIMSDGWIKKMSLDFDMINPFCEDQVRKNVISYGVSSYGYDIRISNEFRLLNLSDNNTIIDPKNIKDDLFADIIDDFCIIPPHSFVLGKSLEYFKIPRNVLTICFGKSTYARCGIIVNITPFEPQWNGHATLGISNTTPYSVKIYANEGIAQVLFLEGNEVCNKSYADKKGKYQSSSTITLAKV